MAAAQSGPPAWEDQELQALLKLSAHDPQNCGGICLVTGATDSGKLGLAFSSLIQVAKSKPFRGKQQLKDTIKHFATKWAFHIRSETSALLCSCGGFPGKKTAATKNKSRSHRCSCPFRVNFSLRERGLEITSFNKQHACEIGLRTFYSIGKRLGQLTEATRSFKSCCELVLKNNTAMSMYLKNHAEKENNNLRDCASRSSKRTLRSARDRTTADFYRRLVSLTAMCRPMIHLLSDVLQQTPATETYLLWAFRHLLGNPHCKGLNLEGARDLGKSDKLMEALVDVLCDKDCQIYYLNVKGIDFFIDKDPDNTPLQLLLTNLDNTKITHFFSDTPTVTPEQKKFILSTLRKTRNRHPFNNPAKEFGKDVQLWKDPLRDTRSFLSQVHTCLNPTRGHWRSSFDCVVQQLEKRSRVQTAIVSKQSSILQKLDPSQHHRGELVYLIQFNDSLNVTEGSFLPWFKIEKSTIEKAGMGLFADKDFSQGEVMAIYGGTISSKPKKGKYIAKWGDASKYVDGRGLIDGKPPLMGIQMTNDPNWKRSSKNKALCNCVLQKDLTIVARRDVHRGDEIFLDYNEG